MKDCEKMLMIKIIILLFTLLYASLSYAQWFETEGTAQIKNGDVALARTKAIEDALRQAMLESGSFITSEQEISNGAISKDNFSLSSSNDVKQYTLVSQSQKDNFLTVRIRVFIDNQFNLCLGEAYPKNVLPILFTYDLNQFQESSYSLTDLNAEITRAITSKLNTKPRLNVLGYYNKNLGLDPIRLNPNKDKFHKTLLELALTKDAQFIILGIIRDISTRQREGLLNSFMDNENRALALSIYVYNALSGSLVYSNDYSGDAPWDKNITNAKSSVFWESQYGKLVTTIINGISNDIEKTLTCQKPTGIILKELDEGAFYINLGSKNGIKQGTRFYIDHNASFVDNYGNVRYSKKRSRTILKAISVDLNTAIIKPLADRSGNIQIHDLVFIE